MNAARNILLLALALMAQCVQANPSGPDVVSGSASFAQPNANVLNVTNSHNAIINWQSFNIGAGQTTNFIQPSTNSAVLNQVLSNNPSQIHGNLNSNGKVFVINQHGLMIGAGAQINTAGFYGSTLNITNEDFLNGRLKFEGGGLGGIQNYGYIHAGEGGNVVLIAPDIENGGVIEVDGGNVILAAGESITITSLNDASVEFELQSANDSIINLGEIIANQGAVGLFAGNLKHSGAINATGLVRNADGSISLVAQQDIEVTETATLNTDGDEGGRILVQSHHGDVYFEGEASAQGASGSGGQIEILGDRVGLFGAAEVNASGQGGGGEVLIGGDFQGRGETQTARQTQVGPHAQIHADAIDSGDGGKVIVWADDTTLFQGEATAKAGAETGDGGFIEISGKGNLGYYGTADASAAEGESGTVLFDPINVVIQASGPDILTNPLLFSDPGVLLTFDPSQITGITNSGTAVVIQAEQDIWVQLGGAISTNNPSGDGGDITFQAGQSILIDDNITTDNGTLKLYANDLGASGGNRGAGTAAITMADNVTAINAGTGNVEFFMDSGSAGSAGNITVGNVDAAHVLIKHNGTDPGGSVLPTSSGVIKASSVFIDHDGPIDGFVGTQDPNLNLVVDNFGAHIHRETIGGIFITANPNSGTDVTVGNTCYGNGDPGCDSFGPHGIVGVETIEGGGSIELNIGGNLIVDEPIAADDPSGTLNPGNVLVFATGSITINKLVTNNTATGFLALNANDHLFINANITANGIVTLDGDANITPNLSDGADFAAGVTITSTNNDINLWTANGLAQSAGDITFNAGIDINISDGTTFNGIATFIAGNDVNVQGDDFNVGESADIFAEVINITAGNNVNLFAGAASNSHAVLESFAGDITISALNLNLDITTGPAGFDSDALVIANLGNGSLNRGATLCPNCTPLGSFPPLGTNLTGVIAANFPAGVSWVGVVGGGDGFSWSDPLNWSTGGLPIVTADVTINPAGIDTIGVDSGAHSIRSLSMPGDDSLDVFGGSLTFTSASTINTDLSISAAAGLLQADGDLTINGFLNLQQGTLGGTGNVTVLGTTRWNPINPGPGAEDFGLVGSGILFANGGFDLGLNLDNDTLTLDKSLFIGGFSSWLDAGAGGNTITGAGFIVNNFVIEAQNLAQLDIGVPVNNNFEIDKSTGAGALSFTSTLTMLGGSVLRADAGSVVLAFPLNLTPGSILEGFATLTGDVFSNGGTVNVDGDIGTTGTLTIDGDLTLDANSWLVFDLCGDAPCTQSDQLNVTGNVILAGNLGAFWADNFTVTSGTPFTLIPAATSIIGNVANVFGPAGVTASSFVNNTTNYVFNLDTVQDTNINFWTGAGDGFTWEDGVNWTLGTPAPAHFAVVNDANDLLLVTISTLQAVAGVEVQNDLDILPGGRLTLDDASAGSTSTITGSSLSLSGTDLTDVLVANVDVLAATGILWDDGNLSGSGILTLHPVGDITIDTNADNLNLTLVNNSALGSSWVGGAAAGAGTITNNGVLSLDGAFTSAISVTNSVTGSIFKSAAGTTTFSQAVVNNGLLQIDSGVLELQTAAAHFGVFDIAIGTTLALSGGVATSFGTIQGAGTIDILGGSSLTNQGSIIPGGAGVIGTLSVTGTGNLLNVGLIHIDIENGVTPVAGIDYDLLQVTNNIDLQGTMILAAVNAYTVTDGDTFIPITFGSSTSDSLSFIPTGTETVAPTYNANSDLTILLNTPLTITWTGGGADDFWNTPANWDLGVPGASDDAVIPGGTFIVDIASAANAGTLTIGSGNTINHSAGTLTILADTSTTSNYSLSGIFVNGGTLTLDNSTFTITGGTLQGGTLTSIGTGSVAFGAGFNTFSGVTIDTDITILNGQTMRVQGGITINTGRTITLASSGSGTTLQFVNAQSISGNGAIVMGGTSNLNFIDGGGGAAGTLTIGSGINISGSGTVGTNSAGYLTLNLGTITANATDTIQTDLLTNGAGGQLIVDGGTMTMAFAWDNLGTMTVDNGGAFNLGGPFPSSALESGKYVNLDGASTTTITGVMDFQGGVFTITDAVTGTGDLRMISGGRFLNGTLAQSGSATLVIDSVSNSASFDNMVLDMDLSIGNAGVMTVFNGLTINGGRTLTLANTGGNSTLQFSSPQTLTGSGAIVMGAGAGFNIISTTGASGTVTIGTGISISGNGIVGTNSAGFLTLNNGTITANPGDTINTRLLTNGASGSLIANGGTIVMNFDWGNLGSMDVSAGGTFSLGATGGTFNSSAISGGLYLNSDGTGITILSGIMDLQSGSFDLTDSIGDILIQGGTIANGTITASGVATYQFGTGFNTFDNITMGMNVSVSNSRTLRIANGLTINSGFALTLASTGTATNLTHVGTQTVTGNGNIVFDNSVSSLNFIIGTAGTLTIDSNINISGGGTIGTNSAGIVVTNNGTVTANAGQTLDLRNFNNFGTIAAVGGGILSYGVLSNDNDGIIDIGTGSSLSTGNANLTNNSGGVIRGSGTIDVGTGTLVNESTIQPGGVGATGILTVQGSLTLLGSTADLQFEINNTGLVAGTDYDQLVIADGGASVEDLNLNGNGSLTTLLLGGNPVAGTYRLIDVISGGSVIGSFGLESLVVGFAPLNYGATFVETTFTAPPIGWDGGGDGVSWNDMLNWDTNLVPTSADDVTIGIVANVTIAGGANANSLSLAAGNSLTLNSGTLTLLSSSSLDGALTLNGGAIDITGTTLTINSSFTWQNTSTINGNGTGIFQIAPSATATSTLANSARSLNNATVDNQGTWTQDASVNNFLQLDNGTVFDNNGSFIFDTDLGLSSAGGGTFNNNPGSILTSNGSGLTLINTPIVFNSDASTINVVAGSLRFSGGGNFTNATALPGGALNFNSGTFTISSGASFTGANTALDITGGVTDVEAAFVLDTLTLNGGTLNLDTLLAGTALTINNTFTWQNSSTINGNGTGIFQIAPGATATSTLANSNRSLSGVTVDNLGTWTQDASINNFLQLDNGTVFDNNGSFVFDTDLGLSSAGGGTFNNNPGSILTSNISGLTLINTPIVFNSDASTIDVAAGSLRFSGGGNFTNATALPAGALNFNSGTFTISSGASFTGANTALDITGGVTDVEAAFTLDTLTLNGSTLNLDTLLAGTALTINNTFTWQNTSTINGNGTGIFQIAPGATATSTLANSTRSLSNLTVDNQGTWTQAAAVNNALQLDNGTVFDNNNSFVMTSTAGLSNAGVDANFNNNTGSTFTLNSGGNTIVNAGVIFNSTTSTVDVVSGNLQLSGGGTFTGVTSLPSGQINFNNGTFTLVNGSSFTGPSTSVLMNGAQVTDVEGSFILETLTLAGGTLNLDTLLGGATLTVNSAFTWQNSSTINGNGTGIFLIAPGATADSTTANSTRSLSDVTVDNQGTWTQAAAVNNALQLDNGTVFDNNNSFVFDTTLGLSSGGGGTFNNNIGATVSVNSGGTTVVSNPVVFNSTSATIDVISGSLQLNGGGSFNGVNSLPSGVVNFNSGTYTIVNGAGFAGSTPGLLLSGGQVTNVEAALVLDNLTLSGGTLNFDTLLGGTALTINSAFTWQNTSTINGNGTGIFQIAPGATATSTLANSTRSLSNLTVDNQGTWTQAAAVNNALQLDNGTVFDNNNSFVMTSTAGLSNAGVDANFNNNTGSTFTLNSGGNTIVNAGVIFNSTTSTVDVVSGNLQLSGGGTFTGVTSLPSGQINFNNGTFTLVNGSSFTGPSTSVLMNGAQVTDVEGSFILETLTLAGGTLNLDTLLGGATLTVNSAFTWQNSSTINGNGTGIFLIAPGATADSTTANSTRSLSDVTVDNQGTWTQAAAVNNALQLDNGTVFDNNNSFVFDTTLGLSSGGGGTFNNNIGATVSVNSGGTTVVSNPVVFNSTSATIDVISGSLQLNGGGSFNGVNSLPSGVVNFNSGTYTIVNGAGFAGSTPGLLLSGGQVTNVEAALVLDNLTLSGGTLNFDTLLGGTALTINSAFTWQNTSTINGNGTGIFQIAPGATATSTLANSTRSLSNLTVDNQGTWTQAAAVNNALQLDNGTTFDNSGSFQFDNNVGLTSAGGGTFNNNGGTLVVNGGGTSNIPATITFSNTLGTINIQNGNFSLGGNPLTLGAGSLLTGAGTFTGDLTNAGGTINPGAIGSVGILSISGTFTQNSGVLAIEIQGGGGVAGVDYDLLVISGAATINAGSLDLFEINAFSLSNGTNLVPLTYSSLPVNNFVYNVPGVLSAIPTDQGSSLLLQIIDAATSVFWDDGGTAGDWFDPLNWSGDFVPLSTNQVVVGAFDITINGAAVADTLSIGGDLSIVAGGSLALSGSSGASDVGGLFTLAAGSVTLGDSLNLNGGFNWSNTSSIVGGTVNIASATAFNISAGASNTFDGVTVNILGNTTYSGGSLVVQNAAVINNSGQFDFAGDLGIADGGGTASGFNNLDGALLLKSAGAATSAIATSINTTSVGSINVATGTLDLGATTTVILDTAGDVLSGGANVTLVANVDNNAGTVRPGGAGSVGTLAISGNYTNTAGVLEVDITGSAVFDLLAVGNNSTISGGTLALALNAYVPSTADLQAIITCGTACNGTFGTLSAPAGVTYAQIPNALNLTLDTVSVSFFWDGGGDGVNWFDLLNWSLDVLPDSGTDVILNTGASIVYNGVSTISSLTLDDTLTLAGGSLTILDSVADLTVNAGASLAVNAGTLINNGDATLNGGFAQSGGNATFAGVTTANGAFTQSGGVITFNGLPTFNGPFTKGLGVMNLNAGGVLNGTNNSWSAGTISSATVQTLLLGGAPGTTTLAITGASVKTLDRLTLDMNLNDINMSGSGDLVLTNGAIIDNTGGTSFNKSGNGNILGSGTFINNGGLFANLSGSTTIGPTVNFVNDAFSFVTIANGTIILQDPDAGDLGTYNIGAASTLQLDAPRNFSTAVNSLGTLHLNNAASTMSLVGGGFTTRSLVMTGAGANLAGDPVVVQQSLLWNGGTIASNLTTNPGSTLAVAGNITLPGTASINGDVALATGSTLNLNGNLLQLNNLSSLSGAGTVNGNVINNSGLLLVGGAGAIGTTTITGNYTQNSAAVMVVEVFNNGSTTTPDRLIVSGNATLGGTLVVGFVTTSLGLVTSSFTPITAGSISGSFGNIIDVGGKLLGVNIGATQITIIGVAIVVPQTIVEELVSFVKDKEKRDQAIKDNKSKTEEIIEAILEEEDEEGSLLVCR